MATQAITAVLGGQGWFEVGSTYNTDANSNPVGGAQATTTHNTRLFLKQQRARRGPTPEVFFLKHLDNTRMVKADDPVRKREMRNFACALSILFAMVMVYGWQHFSAIEYGYRIEAKKSQLEQLRETGRELSVQQAQLSDLTRLDREARKLGMHAPRPGQVVRPDLSPETGGSAVMAEARLSGLH